MTLILTGIGLLVLAVIGWLVAFLSSDFNTGSGPQWVDYLGYGVLAALVAGVGCLVVGIWKWAAAAIT